MLSVIFEVIHKRDIGKEVLVKRFMKGIFHLNRTKDIWSGPELFITTQSPFKAASKSMIATWIKIGLRMAGIDMDMFTPHSTRSASTSAVVTKIPIDTIIRTAGWASDCTFRKFYKRPITNDSSFSVALLT